MPSNPRLHWVGVLQMESRREALTIGIFSHAIQRVQAPSLFDHTSNSLGEHSCREVTKNQRYVGVSR
jgi:hypothetical protein